MDITTAGLPATTKRLFVYPSFAVRTELIDDVLHVFCFDADMFFKSKVQSNIKFETGVLTPRGSVMKAEEFIRLVGENLPSCHFDKLAKRASKVEKCLRLLRNILLQSKEKAV